MQVAVLSQKVQRSKAAHLDRAAQRAGPRRRRRVGRRRVGGRLIEIERDRAHVLQRGRFDGE